MRSAVYRSFVTCDDPEGVIECGTIRKSKFCPKKLEEAKVIPSGKKKKEKNQREEEEEEEEEEDKSSRRRSSSLQLNEVARDALKLNRMADSYSNRSSFDGNSKEMAKDLLKGALDLQESLIMLGKLQESSIDMAKLKKKEQNDQILGFQKPRHSVSGSGSGYNGYSKDCFDELREAIREGLAKQHLLLRRRRNPESSSSSSSSMTQNSQQNLISNSTRPGNPNLIAKLMGLDHIPPRANSYKQQVKKKFEDAQPPPIVIIKPARLLNPDFDTKEILKISDLNKKQMTKADQKPVKRLNQELGLKDMRRTRFKHQEDSFKPKASVGAAVPRKKKEEGTQRRRSTPEQNTKPISVSKSNEKTKNERIVHVHVHVPVPVPVPTIAPRFQNSKHKSRQNHDKPNKATKREEEDETPKEIISISNKADQKDNQSEISEEKSTINIIDTKDLLLSSPLFIAYAEGLFNLDIDTPANTAIVDSGSENDRRLITDYAKEFMQERCRNRRMEESFDTNTVTLEQLAEEVCNGIGSLDRVVKENAANGGLDAAIIRSWNLGWREMDLIVAELEKMISRDLLDSLITDFHSK